MPHLPQWSTTPTQTPTQFAIPMHCNVFSALLPTADVSAFDREPDLSSAAGRQRAAWRRVMAAVGASDATLHVIVFGGSMLAGVA